MSFRGAKRRGIFRSLPPVGTRISRLARNDRKGDDDRTGIFSVTGFTLLELIVVICIVSMMFAAVLPAFSTLKERNLGSEAGRIASALRYLNDRAISTKETCAMQVNIKQKILHLIGPEGEKTQKVESLSGITLQSKGRISEGEVTVLFSSTGAGEHFTIHLTDPETSMDVIFNALSGRVKVFSHERI
jgi:prepilin-type N-terminal cleavage/methylation domain-containing protein